MNLMETYCRSNLLRQCMYKYIDSISFPKMFCSEVELVIGLYFKLHVVCTKPSWTFKINWVLKTDLG